MIDLEKKIAQITLKKLVNISWNKLSLDDVLVKNIKKQKHIKTKNDLLKNLNRYVDSILLEKTKYLENSSTKDMLFEVLMMRFDIYFVFSTKILSTYRFKFFSKSFFVFIYFFFLIFFTSTSSKDNLLQDLLVNFFRVISAIFLSTSIINFFYLIFLLFCKQTYKFYK